MTEPLTISFDVACPVEHAFSTWTTRIGTWWPRDHTVSTRPGLTIVLEPALGGRIYEREPDGTEHDWGQVTGWDPPHLLRYLWHLRRDRADATDVTIRFTATGPSDTRVDITHAGWERLGAEALTWRHRNRAGWATLLPHYQEAIGADGPPTTKEEQ